MAEVTRREAIGTLTATAGVGALLAAVTAPERANANMTAETYHHEARASDLHVEWGLAPKANDGGYEVKFKRAFAEPPAVLLTPYWEGQGAAVGFIETLDKVSRHGFKAISGNAAENYYVSWVAIGRRRD
jgi:hypothetical protein